MISSKWVYLRILNTPKKRFRKLKLLRSEKLNFDFFHKSLGKQPSTGAHDFSANFSLISSRDVMAL